MNKHGLNSFGSFIFDFWMYPLGIAFLIGLFVAWGTDDNVIWRKLLLFTGAFILTCLLIWWLKMFHKWGYNEVIYGHYLKRKNLKQSLIIEPTDSTEDSRG